SASTGSSPSGSTSTRGQRTTASPAASSRSASEPARRSERTTTTRTGGRRAPPADMSPAAMSDSPGPGRAGPIPNPHPPTGHGMLAAAGARDRADFVSEASRARGAGAEREELGTERHGVVARTPLDPRAAFVGDEAGERDPVVERRDRRKAAAADGRDAGALGLDAAARLGVVGSGDEILFAGPHLQRERALRRLRQEVLRIEPMPDLAREPEPVEPARREHDRVEAALAALAQARVDVAAQRLDRERRLEREQLCAPPHRRSPDPHSRPDRGRAAERVARV